MNMPLGEWAVSVTGQQIDMDGVFGPQSPDLVNHYLDAVCAEPLRRLGHGIEMAEKLGQCPGWEALGPNVGALPGDVVSMTSSAPYGDAAVVLGDLGTHLAVMHQNPEPAGVQIIHKGRVVAYARRTPTNH